MSSPLASLPQFPEFKRIEPSDRANVSAHTDRFEPYSDFNFNCLTAWDTGARMISELKGNLVVKFTDYETDEPFLSFLGDSDQEGTVRVLIEYSKAHGLPTTLRLVPPVSVDGLDPSIFIVEENRGDFDYMYETKNIASLSGNKFQRKRESANRFRREHPSSKPVSVNLSDSEVRQRIINTFRDWEGQKRLENKHIDARNEFAATERLLTRDRLDLLHAVGLYVNGTMIGYAIGEKIYHTATIHFLKSTNSYKGASDALMQGYAIYLDSLGVTLMNFESDLGDENLRRAKSSWHPSVFLKRYSVRYAHT